MNKTQVAVVLALGAALGAGGKQLAESFSASAAGAVPRVHAVDLRREPGSHAVPRVLVYGNVETTDGGFRDVGQARSCKLAPATESAASATMDLIAKDCVWP